MAGEAQHVDVLFLDINVQMTGGLNGIGVERNAGGLTDSADFRDRQNRANLVVGEHGGYQTGVRADGILYLLCSHIMVFLHIQQGDLKALFFQLVQSVEYSVVLKSSGNDVLLTFPGTQPGGGDDGLIVGLAAAGGEGDLPGLAAETGGNPGTGGFQSLFGLLTYGMEAGGIAVNFIKIRNHGVNGRGAHLGGGSIICVNLHV